MTSSIRIPATLLLALTLAAPAWAQQGRRANPFDDQTPPPPNTTYQGPQGFSFPGDELPPSHDRKQVGRYDDRYSQTYQQQRTEAQKEAEKPGGGCFKYGAAGALGGYAAGGHSVIGALAGCAVGSYVRRRDQARIERDTGR